VSARGLSCAGDKPVFGFKGVLPENIVNVDIDAKVRPKAEIQGETKVFKRLFLPGTGLSGDIAPPRDSRMPSGKARPEEPGAAGKIPHDATLFAFFTLESPQRHAVLRNSQINSAT
jgi:hypothetical protein